MNIENGGNKGRGKEKVTPIDSKRKLPFAGFTIPELYQEAARRGLFIQEETSKLGFRATVADRRTREIRLVGRPDPDILVPVPFRGVGESRVDAIGKTLSHYVDFEERQRALRSDHSAEVLAFRPRKQNKLRQLTQIVTSSVGVPFLSSKYRK